MLKQNSDLRNSIYDGIFANMFATLTGGVFLTGFAIQLGMNEFMIGLLGSMPFIATLFQLPASYFIWKNGRRKKVAFFGAFFTRIIWIPITIIAFLPLIDIMTRLYLILTLIFFSYSFASVSHIAWLSWTSELVPDGMRGRFFGTRNMLCGAAGMIVMIIFGQFLDHFKYISLGILPIPFYITFFSAILFGILSLNFLKKITEPLKNVQPYESSDFKMLISQPLSDSNFKKYLIFAFFWGFSVHFASPFFTLYFLRELSFSYGFVAVLGVLSTSADLTGMLVWGRLSDIVKNKAVIRFAGWIVVFIPLAWAIIHPTNVVIPMVLQLISGFFWSGINLCTNNLLLRISQHDNKPFFLSVFNIIGGLGAATSPIIAGFFLNKLVNMDIRLFNLNLLPIQFIFITSTFLRLISFQILRSVNEPEEMPAFEIVRIIRGLRGLNVASGFNSFLHPFIAFEKENKD
ncbi:MFS transporter [Thermodesulfobacteriota bacterium]